MPVLKWISDRLRPAARPRRANQPRRRPAATRRLSMQTLQQRAMLVDDMAVVTGVAFLDENGNGTQESSESPLSGVDVTLYRDINGNAVFDPGTDELAGSVTTAADGVYTFDELDGSDEDGPSQNGQYVLTFDEGAGGIRDASGAVLTGVSLSGDLGVTVADTALTIDDFGTQGITLRESQPGQTESGSSGDLGDGSNVLGLERDATLRVTANSDPTRDVEAVYTVSPSDRELQLSEPVGILAELEIQYDGLDGSPDLDATGLNPAGDAVLNFSEGDDAAGINLSVRSNLPIEGAIEVLIYTDATRFSQATLDVIGNNTQTVVLLPFATRFAPAGPGGEADFQDIGAVVLRINADPTGGGLEDPETAANAGADISVSVLDVEREIIRVVNAAATVPLSLGGELFVDNGAGVNRAAQNDGSRDTDGAGEDDEPFFIDPAGRPVNVELYNRDPRDAAAAPIAQSTIASVGDNPGTYLFENLNPDTYFVVIPENQFSSGDPLFGFRGSDVAFPGSGSTDANADDDNDGVFVDGLGFVAGPITLSVGQEPLGPENDANVNTTVDFGVLPVTDLQIAKVFSAADSNATPGGTAVFTVTVTNLGDSDATDVVVQDVLPTGLSDLSVVDSDDNPVDAPQISEGGETFNRFTVGDLAAGASRVFTLTTTIDASATGAPDNLIRVAGFEVETDLSNNEDTAPVALTSAVIGVTKTDGVEAAEPGDQLTYTITVTNTAAVTALDVTAIDTLPAGVSIVGQAAFTENNQNPDPAVSTSTINDDGTVSFTFGDLEQGQTGQVRLTVMVDEAIAAADATLSNSVIAMATNAPDVTASDTTTVDLSSEITVLKRTLSSRTPGTSDDDDDSDDDVDDVEPIEVFAGGFLTYQITIDSVGPATARGITATDMLQTGLTYVAGSFDAGTSGATITVDGQNLSFDVGELPAGQGATFTFEVRVDSSVTDTIENVVTARTADGPSVMSEQMNDPQFQIDLTIDKTAAPATLIAGTTGQANDTTFTIVVSHDGDSLSDALGVNVVDTLPAGLVFVSATSGGTAVTPTQSTVGTPAGTELTFPAFDLPVGQTRTITVNATAAAAATGTLTNTVTVAVPNRTETDLTNNSAQAAVTVNPAFDVTVDKTVVGDASVGVGDAVQFQIVVGHDLNDDGTEADNGISPSTATGIVLTDSLPAGLTFDSVTGGTATTSITGGVTNVVFDPFDLTPGQTQTFTVNAIVAAGASGNLVNNATITADTGETDTTNNSDSASVTVDAPDVDITVAKSVDLATAQSGDTLVYSIVVTNNGPITAEGIVATDTLPAGVTFVSGDFNGTALTATAAGVVTVNVGSLADDATATFTLTARIDDDAAATQTNTVSVTTTTPETNTGNNNSAATTSVTAPQPASNELSGRVFLDFDGNGLQDRPGEESLEGILVQLTGTGITTPLTTTTDESGDYVFANLADGEFTVRRMTDPSTVRTGLVDGLEQAGPESTPTQLGDTIDSITLGPDDRLQPGLNFALEPMSKRRLLSSFVRG